MITKYSLKHISLLLAFYLCSFTLIGQNLPQKPNPPKFVNDLAHMLQDNEAQALEYKLHAYRDSTSNQVIILTVPTLEGHDVESYANEIGRTWGIGEKGKNNGVLILIAQQERKTRIEVGYGLEGAIPDAATKDILREIIKPNFKQENYYQGFDQAIDRIMALAAGEYKAPAKKREGNGVGGIVIIFVIILVIIFSFISKFRSAKRSHIGNDLSFWTILSLLSSMGDNHRNRGGGSGWGGGSNSGGGGWDFGGGDFGGGGSSGDW